MNRALIERIADVQIEVANDLARRLLAGETFKTRYIQLECAKAALNAVYEALKEPGDKMVEAAKLYPLAGSSDLLGDALEDEDIRSILALALSSSPLGKGERQPVNNGGNSDG